MWSCYLDRGLSPSQDKGLVTLCQFLPNLNCQQLSICIELDTNIPSKKKRVTSFLRALYQGLREMTGENAKIEKFTKTHVWYWLTVQWPCKVEIANFKKAAVCKTLVTALTAVTSKFDTYNLWYFESSSINFFDVQVSLLSHHWWSTWGFRNIII